MARVRRQSSKVALIHRAVGCGAASIFEQLERRQLFSAYVVNTTADTGAGSLRDAIAQVNNNVNDEIDFIIPGGGVQTIHPQSELPAITKKVLIDGTKQPGYTDHPLVEISGNLLSGEVAGLTLQADNSEVDALCINQFSGEGINLPASSVTIKQCFIGTSPDGTSAKANTLGMNINGGSNIIGGSTDASGNVISGNTQTGVYVSGNNASSNTIQHNRIGVTPDGKAVLGNGYDGIYLFLKADSTVVKNNVIGGNDHNGIYIDGPNSCQIESNDIGTSPAFSYLPNHQSGILIDNGSSSNDIGGSGSNNIYYSFEDGVRITSGANNSIVGDRFYGNGKLGIDLGTDDDVTPNDPDDVDTGANQLQNFPVLVSASSDNNTTTVHVTFKGAANSNFKIELHTAYPLPNENQYGQGGDIIGTKDITTDPQGYYEGDIIVGSGESNRYLTATATDADGNTSEFSKCVQATNTKQGAPSLYIVDLEVVESNADQVVMADVNIASPLNYDLQFEYTSMSGTATKYSDFICAGDNDIEAGQTSVQIPVTIYGDTMVEGDEAFYIQISPIQADDVNMTKNTATVTIDDDDSAPPPPQNGNPVANDDSATTNENTPVTVNVLGNDSDPDGDPISIIGWDVPNHGQLKNVNNKLVYTPNNGFAGTDQFGYEITDNHNATAWATLTITVKAKVQPPPPPPPVNVKVVPDPCDASKTALQITGTSAADVITVASAGAQGKAKVTLNGKSQGTFNFTGKILAYGLGGNDKITIDSAITRTAWIDAGSGNDTINGGGGADLILGRDGNDKLYGNSGRDILVGDDGADSLSGGSGEDVLLAGTLNFDGDLSNFCGIEKEWTRTDKSFTARVSDLQKGGAGTLNGSRKINAATADSGAYPPDTLTGGNDSDAFFFNFTASGKYKDVVTDKGKSDMSIDVG